MTWADLIKLGILKQANDRLSKDERNLLLFASATLTVAASLALTSPDDLKPFSVKVSNLIADAAAGVSSLKRVNLLDVFRGRSIDPLKEWREKVRVFARAWNYPQEVLDALG